MSQINESNIKTPGVYVTEIPSFPPSIAQVATAVPAFIGYTATAIDAKGNNVTMKAVRISSLAEYARYFGEGFPNLTANVILKPAPNNTTVDHVEISPAFQMYNAIRLFFNHGGINCYIISIGPYFESDGVTTHVPALVDFVPGGTALSCFDILRKKDEPTLIVIPDAIMMPDINDFNSLMTSSLQLCAELQDRFAIMDVYSGDEDRTFDDSDVIDQFRSGVGGSDLNYGAAYYPWLRTNLPSSFSYHHIQLQDSTGANVTTQSIVGTTNAFVTQINNSIQDHTSINGSAFMTGLVTTMPAINNIGDFQAQLGVINNNLIGFINSFNLPSPPFTDINPAVNNGTTVQSLHDNYIKVGTGGVFSRIEKLIRNLILIDLSYPTVPPSNLTGGAGVVNVGNYTTLHPYQVTGMGPDPNIYGTTPAPATDGAAITNILPRLRTLYNDVIKMIQSFSGDVQNLINGLELNIISSSTIYANIKMSIVKAGVVVPPSGAMAGVYASVDGTRGVWKAPANVTLNTVIEPTVTIDDNMQEDLNVDTNAGKSVNAIRAFTGKGTLVWGARTLDGNSSDFRYISVRRFYIMVEESVKLATYQFVFEPNDAATWVRVRAMIENYLTNLWRLGALAGPKPEQAFYVKVGLGQTMTFDDVLSGKMIVEIGMAPVRPAEFIILRFSQIQQQA